MRHSARALSGLRAQQPVACVAQLGDGSQPLPRCDTRCARLHAASRRHAPVPWLNRKQYVCMPIGRPIAPPRHEHALFRMQNR
ncbi:hypothetical protein A6R73_16065 [Xanthomonas translucens pv. poae]|uniref:Uncharacterized protein n=1 Tax=Xanthomonas graminis pv. poae TaxID=227946 RepID=A0A199P3B5_9XANT|nr:hypothetical protein A6R73_16065 [Xanthomonas translucens pv. poae]